MAARRTVRTARRAEDDELAERADDELAEEPDDELAEDPDDELAEDPDDELAEEPYDELAEEPDDEVAEDEPEEANGTGRRSRPGRSGGLTAAKAGQAALRQIAELTGKDPEGVTGIEPADDGWMVGVEVVEDRRIPSSVDILATYETELDSGGDLVSYRRVKRYTRGHGDSED
jgi:hypothetical protein